MPKNFLCVFYVLGLGINIINIMMTLYEVITQISAYYIIVIEVCVLNEEGST